jgi:dynein heavy chain
VQAIVEPVETALFDAFERAHAPQWRALRARFFADNEEVKAATRELIDTSFRKLRSAEGAFDLLQVRSAVACCCRCCACAPAVDDVTACMPRCRRRGQTCHTQQNFKSIKSRGAIQQQMMNKLVDTLEQFLREIVAAQDMFDRCKADPPRTRNQPPVAGACVVRWPRSIRRMQA